MDPSSPDLASRRAARRALARERMWNAAAIGLGVLAIIQFGSLVILWFVPYHITGLANEFGLLALAVAIAITGQQLLRRTARGPAPPRATFCLAAVLYIVASMAGLSWSVDRGISLSTYRYALFSTPNCDFVARFDRPPQLGRFKGAAFEADRTMVKSAANLAILADLDTFNSYRSECQPIGDAKGAITRDVVQAAALQWADEIGLKIAHQSLGRDERGEIFELGGEIAGSILPETPGRQSRTLVGMRSYIGARSVMSVYVFQPQGDTLSPQTIAFLDGVRRR